ncbi:hypothetical protein QQ045_009007 [Rhodiola kirilowii]
MLRYKNQTVAIKIVQRVDAREEIAKRERRFAREAAMLSRVQHKNLVKFVGACKVPIMAIDYSHRALDWCLDASTFGNRQLIGICGPENNKTSRLWIGKRRDTDRDNDWTAETGTYRWMAPELYSTVTLRQGEKKHCNNKGDAYSFAIVLCELLHNKLPFEECEA